MTRSVRRAIARVSLRGSAALVLAAMALQAPVVFAEGKRAKHGGKHGASKEAAAPSKDSAAPSKDKEKELEPAAATSSSAGAATVAAATPTSTTSTSSSSDDSVAQYELIDGPGGCAALIERNERDKRILAEDKAAPRTAFKDERPSSSPLGGFLQDFTKKPALLAATIIPHINAALRDASPQPGLSFPWSVPLGPPFSCSRKHGTLQVAEHWPLRLMLEPGILIGDRNLTFFLRPGARYVHHPSDWVVGLGAGFGPFFEFGAKDEPGARIALSPEVLVQFGTCCEPGYVTLAFRREFFLAGRSQLWFATVGFTYF